MAQQLVPNPAAEAMFPPPPGDVGDYFTLESGAPDAETFEIGLVLGGTVSAAAYTAGVIDFLIEALDAWTKAKEAGDPAAPGHKVVIKILAGTSGGGITSVLLSRILGSAFPHCDLTTPENVRARNPLYDIWVNQVDISDLLQTSDLKGTGQVSSLLCTTKLDQVCAGMATYAGGALGSGGTPAARDYVERWLPVVLTLTNLRGIPYSANFRGNSERPEYFTDHADHMRFLVDLSGNNPPAPAHVKPYEVAISATPANGIQPWGTIIHVARGTSAFPGGLTPQVIARDPHHYLYRYAVVSDDAGTRAEWLRAAWPYMIPVGATAETPYQFLCVDGGCFNNEPVAYAREWLAGVLGRNERAGDKAHRAVMLVDPFADTPSLGLTADPGVLGTLGATVSGWVGGARFETSDLSLFMDENVFSRFLVNPVRKREDGKTLTGGDAIATSCLGAFGGFLSKAFRAHDFFLGRRNCQQFLRRSFMLPESNSLFAHWPDKAGAVKDGFLPIVPLMAGLDQERPQPVWPKNTFRPDSIKNLVEKRLEALSKLAADALFGPQGMVIGTAENLLLSALGGHGADKVMEIVRKGLQNAGLLD